MCGSSILLSMALSSASVRMPPRLNANFRRKPCGRTRCIACASIVFIITLCLPALADEKTARSTPNRLGVSVGPSVEFHDQGEYSPFCNGCFAFAARLAYFREIIRRLEVGASFGYRHDASPEHTVQAVFPAIALRPYLPFAKSDQFEIGLPIHGLLQVTWTPEVPGTWLGFGVGVGPDFRAWVSESAAISLGVELVPEFPAHNPNAPDLSTGFNKDPTFTSFRAWFGGLGAF